MRDTTRNQLIELDQLPPDLLDDTKSFLRYRRAHGSSTKTIQTYTQAIRAFGTFLVNNNLPVATEAIRAKHIEAFLRDLSHKQQSAATISNRFKVLSSFFGWLLSEREIRRHPMAKMIAPKVQKSAPQTVASGDWARLLKVCEGKAPLKQRDKAMVSLLRITGMRRSELAALEVADIDLDNRVVYVRTNYVRTDNVRPRVLHLDEDTAKALAKYLQARAKHRHARRPELWLGLAGPLTASGVAAAIDRVARAAGVDHLNVRMFRSTIACSHLSEGKQGRDLMRQTGWRSRSMVSRYASEADGQQLEQDMPADDNPQRR